MLNGAAMKGTSVYEGTGTKVFLDKSTPLILSLCVLSLRILNQNYKLRISVIAGEFELLRAEEECQMCLDYQSAIFH